MDLEDTGLVAPLADLYLPFGSTREISISIAKIKDGKWYFSRDFFLALPYFELGEITAEPICQQDEPVSVVHSTTGFVPGSAETRKSREYEGTVDEFANALPGLVQRAVAASGLPPQNYEKEIAYIINAARTCAAITPQMAAGIQWYGQENLRKLGATYEVCRTGPWGINVSDKVRTYNHEHERGLLMKIYPRGLWKDGQGFTVTVLFTSLAGDTGVTLHNMEDAYGAVFATIDPSQTSGMNGAANDGAPVKPIQGNGGQPPNSQVRGGFRDANPPNSARLASSLPAVIPPPTPSKSDERTLRLTRTNPSETRTATITAPGRGLQDHNVFHIDARDFAEGGTLVIDIDISRNSATDGSFDLFPDGVPIPVQGTPAGTLTGAYNVRRGSSTRLEYRFGRGQVFALNLEGNWFSPKGATGPVQFRATVRK